MNVLFVTTISGFLPQFEYNDARILRKLGCKLFYASDFDRPVYRYDGSVASELELTECPISIEKSPVRIIENTKAILELKKIIDEKKIDIIHCHNAMGGVVARIAARLSARKPYVIYTAHGFHFFRGAPLKNWLLYYTAERMLSAWTDCIITINSEDYKRASHLPLRKKGNVHYIHGVGVDDKRFCQRKDLYLSKRQKFGVPENAFHIVTAAELNDNKNMSVIIKAISEIADKNIYYSICGEGRERKNLEKLISDLSLEDRVKLHGYRNDMEEVLEAADAFAFPSKREGLGVAAVEALLSGVPLICSDNRGTREYASAGYNAIICRSGSIKEYARAITKLSGDKEYRDKLASHCTGSASKFVLGETEKIMRPIYEKAISERSTS